jgi:hypothetical protein
MSDLFVLNHFFFIFFFLTLLLALVTDASRKNLLQPSMSASSPDHSSPPASKVDIQAENSTSLTISPPELSAPSTSSLFHDPDLRVILNVGGVKYVSIYIQS